MLELNSPFLYYLLFVKLRNTITTVSAISGMLFYRLQGLQQLLGISKRQSQGIADSLIGNMPLICVQSG